jgi:hypothetical protein
MGFDAYMDSLKGDIAITAEPWTRKTSNPQFAYYYAVPVKLLADHTGFTKDEMDVVLRNKFLSRPVSVPVKDGEFLMVCKVLSKTAVTTAQFEEFLTEVRNWAIADLGVVIPLPNEVDYT